jgi:signal transduction histidine kinase
MIYVILAVVSMFAVYFCICCQLQRKAIRDAARELHHITDDLEQNRVIKLTSPHRDLEMLLTEINHNLMAIRKTRTQFQRKEVELKKQIENISHDLRTPLTAIVGFIGLIDKKSLNSADQDSFEVIERKVMVLKRLIAQFYDLSRLTADDYQLNIQEVDLGRKIREAILEYYVPLKHKKMEVELNIPETAVTVLADEGGLDRILANLFQNVVRYAHSRINISLQQNENRVVVQLNNDTIDLNTQEVSMLFERFYTSDTSRTREGTGLGLPIAKHLAESMGGRLYADLSEINNNRWLSVNLELPGLGNGK